DVLFDEEFIEEEPWQELGEEAITVMGEAFYLEPETQGAFLVQVKDPFDQVPVANGRVQVLLNRPDGNQNQVFAGQTDSQGLIQVNFDVPDLGMAEDELQGELSAGSESMLTIIAETDYDEVQYQQPVYVGRAYNVLITTDKPVYQPGQTIHIRGLALDSNALKSAQGEPLLVTVQDPQGNRVMRKTLTTSDYGIAATDFMIDSQAASGDYIVTAEMGPVTSSRSVEVKPYTLPRFEITFDSEKSFYMPGDIATGTVDAQYFFGKPVVGGQVIIKGFVTDVDRFQVFELAGETDETGFYAYEFQVPDYFVGQLESNTAKVDLEITVIDTANHAENTEDSVTIAEQVILVEAIAESGFLRPNLENIIYLQTTYPNGRSAQTTLNINTDSLTDTVTIETDEFGLATITVTPRGNRDVMLEVVATDADGQQATQEIALGTSGTTNAVLIRPERPQYQIGETLNIDIQVAGNAVTAYLDVIKGRQTFGLAALPVSNGVAQAAIDLDGSLLGTLELNAYVITGEGEIVRDRRFILVNPAPAEVNIQTDADVYRPGDTATLDITVNRDGAPMPSALGISIVDESVFAVGAQNPGFARTYFLLERELQEPRYEIRDFVPLRDSDYSPYDKSYKSSASALMNPQDVALFGLFAQELAYEPDVNLPVYESIVEAVAVAPAPSQLDAILTTAYGWGYRLPFVIPLLGLAIYDGTRRRRRVLAATVMIGLSSFIWVACAPAGAPMADFGEESAAMEAPAEDMSEMEIEEEAEMDEADFDGETTATRGQAKRPRLRQFFPETLYWMPEVETDENGVAQLDVPIADSITTWRISVLASDKDGNLGSAEVGMRVFQDFFVEPDLPRFLTVGDELAMPVSIFNYLDEAQTITLEIADAEWFEFAGDPELTVEIAANEVAATYIPIRVLDFGTHNLQITAIGSQMSDAVLRQVEVLPDGQRQTEVINGKVSEDLQVLDVELPANAIDGTGKVTVKLYPGVVSQVLDGLEGMLQQPYGCFEQTSSTTYPNIMVLDYLKTTDQINPQVQLKAEQFINLGYQRLLSFEVGGYPGGFSLFGDPPPQTMLTAYGLMEFTDMSEVSYVDMDLLERTANFLIQRQQPNGSWEPQGMTIESGVERMGEGNLPATAYIAWALADAGYANSAPVQDAIAYIERELGELSTVTGEDTGNNTGNNTASDAYMLGLVANALTAANANARPVLDVLLANATAGPDDTLFWRTGLSTWLDSGGSAANIETTALVAMALLRENYRVDVAQQALDYLVSQKDSFGAFHTTQATVLSLKALLLAEAGGGKGGDATIEMGVNGDEAQVVTINDENGDVVQQVRFEDLRDGTNTLKLQMNGQRGVQYQVITEYYVPWQDIQEGVEPVREQPDAMRVDVTYDRTELQVNDVVNVQAEVELLAQGTAGTILVDLGIPPGFSPITTDLDALVESGEIDRYERTGRQLIFYMTDVPGGQVYTFDYRLRARFPIQAQTPSSTAYDYYTPEQRDTTPPQRIVVTLGTGG
ncbi:MAG: MG2 domain-containing protein, partial [Chloroflexota bacterium]